MFWGDGMYRKLDKAQLSMNEFFMPFGGRLSADNRWVKIAKLMPWDLIEDLTVTEIWWRSEMGFPSGAMV